MLLTEKYGNIYTSNLSNIDIDKVCIEWYESSRRILHKTTRSGIQVSLKYLNENPNFKDGDILWLDEKLMIVIEIISTQCIVITVDSTMAAAALCYEIGNRHLPLFYEENELLIPYDVPMYNLLQSSEYVMRIEERKLNNPFKTTVLPHIQVAGNGNATGKILQLSTTE